MPHNFWRKIGILIPSIHIFMLVGFEISALPAKSDKALLIPKQSEWTDYGEILKAGEIGEWDHFLYGGFTATAIKKNGKYYLYYQGAKGYRSKFDETVTWRAIGVAISSDGMNFTKYTGNPIITWFPNKNEEEGAVSGAVALDNNGEFVMYYGANSEQSKTLVNADARMATSADGITYTDIDVVLDHKDISVWGSGDELFPIIAFQNKTHWFVYYIPNGTLQSRKLGVAWGDSRDNLKNTSRVRSGFLTSIRVWGMGGYAKIGSDTYALFLNDVPKSMIEVRKVSTKTPNRLSRQLETYLFDEVKQATVMLDLETKKWFMYYRGNGSYGVKTAPVAFQKTDDNRQ